MQSVPLDTLQSREAADQYLARHITDRAVRQYLLQNLIKVNGGWAWRFALSVLHVITSYSIHYTKLYERKLMGRILSS